MQPGPPYHQGPQQPYPPQGYPGYPQPGYGPPPKKSNAGLIIGLVIAAVVVLGGGGVAAVLLLSNDSGSSSAAPTSSKKSGPPDKYAAMPGCEKIGSGVRNLPPLETPKGEEPASTSNNDVVYTVSSCSWRESGAPSALVTMYLSKSKEPGTGSGEDWAKAGYDNAMRDGGEVIPTLAKATKAGYNDIRSAGQCSIKLYQGNVEAQVIVSGAEPSKPIDQKLCKENALKVAKATSEAIG